VAQRIVEKIPQHLPDPFRIGPQLRQQTQLARESV
jgi:hypothetical protein